MIPERLLILSKNTSKHFLSSSNKVSAACLKNRTPNTNLSASNNFLPKFIIEFSNRFTFLQSYFLSSISDKSREFLLILSAESCP